MANFEDLIDPEYGLQQDEWSLTRPTFGEQGQLQVVGWSGKSGYNKYYIVSCQVCSRDCELFGRGLFKIQKGGLIGGIVPCGCSKRMKWTDAQFFIRCSRKAEELGFKLLGFEGDFKGNITKLKLVCDDHGEWTSGIISTLLSQGTGCPNCATDKVSKAVLKTDEIMINSFRNSGDFHPDTKFWRSERKTNQGAASYWWMSCPVCETEGESLSHHLQKGQLPCSCSKSRQKQAYINYITDDNLDIPLALKFGIANKSDLRLSSQSRRCIYELNTFGVWEFQTKEGCLAAERECKRTLQCRILTREQMPDGWTETTYPFNLEKIIAIYEKHGGVRIENA